MRSGELVRDNLEKSRDRVLARIEDMRTQCFVRSTPQGGPHTLWVLGHLAYIEGLVIQGFMQGQPNALADWEPVFDGAEISGQPDDFPPFDDVLARCRKMRAETLDLLGSLTEDDLDRPAADVPEGWEDVFGTYRLCLQNVADHWYMHRGHLADARRAAGVERMWV